jgi:hypothetical protein
VEEEDEEEESPATGNAATKIDTFMSALTAHYNATRTKAKSASGIFHL